MTHRAEQIIVAVADLVSALVTPLGVHVYKHRRESLNAEQDELPAISVDYGEDLPADSQPLSAINSVLSLSFTAVVSAPTEAEAREKLLELREYTDGLMSDHMHMAGQNRLELTWVYGIGYGGADAPEINAEGESCTGTLSSTWSIGYRLR